MKKIWILLFPLVLPACKEAPSQPPHPVSTIVAYVHWETQPLAGKQIEIAGTGEIKATDTNGLASFSVPAGAYVLRAYGIDGPGPSPRTMEYNVEVLPGQQKTVDISDCLPCM